MFSHGYYSVISPEGAAAIEGRLKRGERASAELVERCAANLHLTADDNVRFGYIDRVIQEPVLGAPAPIISSFSGLSGRKSSGPRTKWCSACAVLLRCGARPCAAWRDRELNLDEMYVRWDLSKKDRRRLVGKAAEPFSARLARGLSQPPFAVGTTVRRLVRTVVGGL